MLSCVVSDLGSGVLFAVLITLHLNLFTTDGIQTKTWEKKVRRRGMRLNWLLCVQIIF